MEYYSFKAKLTIIYMKSYQANLQPGFMRNLHTIPIIITALNYDIEDSVIKNMGTLKNNIKAISSNSSKHETLFKTCITILISDTPYLKQAESRRTRCLN